LGCHRAPEDSRLYKKYKDDPGYPLSHDELAPTFDEIPIDSLKEVILSLEGQYGKIGARDFCLRQLVGKATIFFG